MGQIYKGAIASISGNSARVVPLDEGAKPTTQITIPWHLRGDTGQLKKGTEVVYVEFDDATGLLLGRADGDWGEFLPYLEADMVESDKMDVTQMEVDQMEAEKLDAGTVKAETLETGEGEGGDSGGGSGSNVPIMSQEVAGIAKVGDNLTIDDEGRLSVDTTDTVAVDNTKPITSAAVHTTVGNIELLLETI